MMTIVNGNKDILTIIGLFRDDDLGQDPSLRNVVGRMKDALFDWQYSLKRRVGLDYNEAVTYGPERDEKYGIIIGRR